MLDLHSCALASDAGMETLRGMPLEALRLSFCRNLTPAALDCLLGMPLSKLDLSGSPGLLGEEGLERLRGLPLTSLNLATPNTSFLVKANLTETSLSALEGLPLRSLGLRCWEAVLSDVSLIDLAKLPQLGSLNLSYCGNLTDGGMKVLGELTTLTRLDLSGCMKITEDGLRNLQGLPLVALGLGGCKGLMNGYAPNVLDALLGLPLTSLSINGWRSMSNDALRKLFSLPLACLDLSKCVYITDVGIYALLEAMPCTNVAINGCRQVNLKNFDAYPLVDVLQKTAWSVLFNRSIVDF